MAKGIKQLYGYPLIDQTARNDIKNNYQKKTDENLQTTDKTIVGGINEVAAQCKDIAKKTITTEERTKLNSLNNYDDTTIKNDINSIKTNIGTETLNTTAQNIKGAVNELNAKIGNGGGGTGVSYDDTAIKADINTLKTDVGTAQLTTIAKDLKGAVNEVAAQCKDLNINALEKMNSASLETFNKSSYMEKITPTLYNNQCVKLDGTMNQTTPEYMSLEFDVQNKNYIYVKNLKVVKASDDYCLYCIVDGTNTVIKVIQGDNQTLNEVIFLPANSTKIRFTCNKSTYADGEVLIYTNIKDVIDNKASYEYVNNTVDRVDKLYELDNLYDKNSNEIMKGHFLSGSGEITERTDRFVTNFMPVTSNDTIYGNFMEPTYFVCYDANKTMIGADYMDTRPEGITFSTISGIPKDKLPTLAYIRLSNELSHIDSMTITKEPSYKAHAHKVLSIKNLKETNNSMINFWEGKVGDSLGDSLTEQGFFQRYTSMYFNLKRFSNHGVGGTKLSGADVDTTKPSMWQDSRIDALKSDADFITILGGENDGDVEIGEISKTNMDTNTYAGALNTIIDKVYKKYNGNIKIILCTPFYVPSEGDDGERFIKFDKAVMEIGRLHGLPVADFGGNCGANKYTKDLYWGEDKTHPIEDFYRDRITPILIETMKKIEPIDYTKCNCLTYQVSQ